MPGLMPTDAVHAESHLAVIGDPRRGEVTADGTPSQSSIGESSMYCRRATTISPASG